MNNIFWSKQTCIFTTKNTNSCELLSTLSVMQKMLKSDSHYIRFAKILDSSFKIV